MIFNKKEFTDLNKKIDSLTEKHLELVNQEIQVQNHLIALARLSFIQPDILSREAFNSPSNLEYLAKLQKELKTALDGKKRKVTQSK